MEDAGYSTMMDAILFLAMVSACALILSAATTEGHERHVADSSLRALASSSLASMETSRVDYFEYRVLGDRADEVAERCGIDPGSWLYSETTKAVLGRGNRHKPVMEIAAEASACQFTMRLGGGALRLNPLTGDYTGQAQATVDRFLRERLDGRYAYNFSMRWTPFAGVPFEGSLSCGDTPPPGAASASALVTMPYRASMTEESIEEAISPTLDEIERSTAGYMAGGSEAVFRERLRSSLGSCLENASRLMVDEALGNTLYQASGDTGNPLSLLASFSDDYVTVEPIRANDSLDVKEALRKMIALYSEEPLDSLVDEIARGVEDGTLTPAEERQMIVRWMCSRYSPSSARATLYVWVRADA
ncbi:DUF7284 family protein [Methanocella conradii]|uniref:DUF7284 family protein n=1 Tax=Methanocella conradii TaxID=1175444 RepID=UPI0024B34463|nr:hypothetical protein [Methanocella conradii]MDI6897733.1 hypothetical protein [Methanocella conradii]